jgi:Tol biopolymer transport system component
MSIRKLLLSPFALLMLLVAIACSDDDPASVPLPKPVATVTVTPNAKTLVVGATTALAAQLADAAGNPINDRPVAWTSDKPEVATVTSAGVVTAIAAGVANVDVSSEGKHATAVITVHRVPVARVDLDLQDLTMAEGESRSLTAVAKDANGNVLADRAITWRSSDNTIATITTVGQLTALGVGTATIAAESEGVVAMLAVTVAGAPVANVDVTGLTQALETGDILTLTARLTDAAGRLLTGRAVAWSTSNAEVATISPNGQVTARRIGQVTLTATSEGKSGSITTTVDAAPSAMLIYQRNRLNSNEIFTLGFGANQSPALLNAGSVSHQPSASADGSRIAFFVSMTTLNGEVVEDIFAVDRVGTNMKRLTSTGGVDDAPAYSPAANLIAYHRLEPSTGRSDIWLMNGDGTNPRNLTGDLPGELFRTETAWTPDGEWIAFTSSRGTAGPGRGSIWIMRADGTAKRQLTLNPGNGFDLSPSWSPDGQRIVFQRGGISIVTVATGEVSNLGLPGQPIQPAWSPDGRHIAFAWIPTEPGSGVSQLYTVRPDGSGMRLRTTNPAWGGGASPAWIPR